MKSFHNAVSAVLTVLLLSAQASAFDGYKRIPVDPTLKGVIQHCNQSRADFSEYILCPSMESYWLADTSRLSLERFLGEEIGIEPKLSESSQAIDILSASMQGHLQFLIDEQTAQAESVAKDYEKTIVNLAAYIPQAEARGNSVYIDPNAEWAPGIAAIAVIVVDNSQQTVTLLMHGNGDS